MSNLKWKCIKKRMDSLKTHSLGLYVHNNSLEMYCYLLIPFYINSINSLYFPLKANIKILNIKIIAENCRYNEHNLTNKIDDFVNVHQFNYHLK